jgi:F-type H+-transporting ATPase subunit a
MVFGKRFIIAVLVIFSTFQVTPGSVGQPGPHEEKTGKKFVPGEFLFSHISDAHEWHIASYKGKHIAIPLPVIIISKNNGIVTFMSGKFHHGGYQKNGFEYRIEHDGAKKGKIAEISHEGAVSYPLDVSITKNIAALWFSVGLILLVFSTVARTYKRNPGKAPKGLQSIVEPVILFVRDDIAKISIGHNYEKYTPFLLTVFFFIWFNNMLGLIPFPPGGANLTGNIAITAVLALFSMAVINFSGNRNYWRHIFNTPGVPIWLKIPLPLMPVIELIGIFTKPFVLMIRLFANITAGHLITLGFLSLIFVFGEITPLIGIAVSPVSIIFLIFMLFLELIVAFIQALVFTFLSALYIGMAVEEHH